MGQAQFLLSLGCCVLPHRPFLIALDAESLQCWERREGKPTYSLSLLPSAIDLHHLCCLASPRLQSSSSSVATHTTSTIELHHRHRPPPSTSAINLDLCLPAIDSVIAD
ncbi:unnamed protein product [Linum trigynum]|uniref:Uncharacterized protein n=1 Tax=Linum trigynum TaxID=586398 RepID=A0AAV2G4R5_9ROSI